MTGLFKVLYVDKDVDEPSSSQMLERATVTFEKPCAFTVVSSAFQGLECTGHTMFDVIMIKSDNQHDGDINPLRMQEILRSLHVTTPIVLMTLKEDASKKRRSNSDIELRTFRTLQRPFTTAELLDLFASIVHPEDAVVIETVKRLRLDAPQVGLGVCEGISPAVSARTDHADIDTDTITPTTTSSEDCTKDALDTFTVFPEAQDCLPSIDDADWAAMLQSLT